ncbi:hypothetical protein K474DRAFT_1594123 [Panus rudis PR-1116 ss-1]|nr:hypothetical protein K474DRAFT_1594123 [Panus rudis PR-1116 ss-1]
MSWSDLDLSLVIALVSPIGNWLTGSDHIKNTFLIAFLIFYLHQLIEVPWRLYQAALPRKSTARNVGVTSRDVEPLASELRTLELFYLSLTVLSPLVGAYLIRFILRTLEGVDNLSWFSTALFVLATGVRPWTHLVSRLRQRTEDLHDAIHYPAEEIQARQHADLEKKLESIARRLEEFESNLRELTAKTERIEPMQEVCDDLSEALGDVERSILRHDRKLESVRVAHDARLQIVEAGLVQVEQHQRRKQDATEAGMMQTLPYNHEGSYLELIKSLLREKLGPYLPRNKPHRGHKPLQEPAPITSRTIPVVSIEHETTFIHSTPLETIPEVEGSDSEGTYVSGDELSQRTSPVPRNNGKRAKGRSRSRSGTRAVRKKTKMSLVELVYYVMTWPYRASAAVLMFFTSPLRKVLC